MFNLIDIVNKIRYEVQDRLLEEKNSLINLSSNLIIRKIKRFFPNIYLYKDKENKKYCFDEKTASKIINFMFDYFIKMYNKEDNILDLGILLKRKFGEYINLKYVISKLKRNKKLNEELIKFYDYRARKYKIVRDSELEQAIISFVEGLNKNSCKKLYNFPIVLNLEDAVSYLTYKGLDYIIAEDLVGLPFTFNSNGSRLIRRIDIDKSVKNGDFNLVPYKRVLTELNIKYPYELQELVEKVLRRFIYRDNFNKLDGLSRRKLITLYGITPRIEDCFFLRIKVELAKEYKNNLKKGLLLL